MNAFLEEEPRTVPVVADVDLCVVGGGCTGVFAAVRAARMGLNVAIVETLGQFGGAATSRLVNVWHSCWSTDGSKQTIAGLTTEVMERLGRRGAVIEAEKTNPNWQFCFSAAELSCELDTLLLESGVRPFLHARVVAAKTEEDRIAAVILEDKSGRRAIRASQFVDASGDADLVLLAKGNEAVGQRSHLQPPTMAVIVDGVGDLQRERGGGYLANTIYDETNPHHLPKGFLWAAPLPGSPALKTIFGTRVVGVDCSDADELTHAEMEGRGQARKIVDAIRHQEGDPAAANLVAFPACIGIRDTRFVHCASKVTEADLLEGVAYADTIGAGTYRVDVHHQGQPGITFRYLDGRELVRLGDSSSISEGRWREERDVDPLYYQIPFSAMQPKGLSNVLVAGRCIDADIGAFGALRVMVNCNQMGEAAGVASALAQTGGSGNAQVEVQALRRALDDGGSIVQSL